MSLLSGTPVILVRDSPESEKYNAILDLFSSSYPLGFLKYEPLIQLVEKRFEASPTSNSSEVSHAWREGIGMKIQLQLELKEGNDCRR